MKKKAITPLISTFLLVLFATALGFIVMSWGRSTYAIEERVCEDAIVAIVSIGEKEQVCYKDSMLYLTLENNGIKIDGIKVIILADDIGRKDIKMEISSADMAKLSTDYAVQGEIKKIKIIPQIMESTCIDGAIEIENILPC